MTLPTARHRKCVMTALAAVFLLQSWFVYTDKAGRRHHAPSAAAVQGQMIWRHHNCQTCHQLFGLGGFLGPDLTHVTERLSPAAFSAILQVAPFPMPPQRMSADEITDIYAFLQETDAESGVTIAASRKRTLVFSEIP
ncbi:MAG: c-type cytochrome, partial [Alphaproteobacteria bacterium]|nr:c-type cytochrome [Alphaproteobacteria bacterium]